MEKIIKINEGISVLRKGKELIFSKNGVNVSREIFNPLINLEIKDNEIRLISKKDNKTLKRILGTLTSHIKNMIKGVENPYFYRLKICGTHFPITVKVEGNKVIITNLFGEKVPRTCKVIGDAKVVVKGDIIEVSSSNKEYAGMTAGIIEKITKRSNFDSRVFQDGIYIIEKAGKVL